MSNALFIEHQNYQSYDYFDLCQSVFEKEIYNYMFLEFIAFDLVESKAKLKYFKIFYSKDNFWAEFKINNQKNSILLNDKNTLNEQYFLKRITQEEYQKEITKIYQLERYLKNQNNTKALSDEIFERLKILFKDRENFQNYIDQLELTNEKILNYSNNLYSLS